MILPKGHTVWMSRARSFGSGNSVDPAGEREGEIALGVDVITNCVSDRVVMTKSSSRVLTTVLRERHGTVPHQVQCSQGRDDALDAGRFGRDDLGAPVGVVK